MRPSYKLKADIATTKQLFGYQNGSKHSPDTSVVRLSQ